MILALKNPEREAALIPVILYRGRLASCLILHIGPAVSDRDE